MMLRALQRAGITCTELIQPPPWSDHTLNIFCIGLGQYQGVAGGGDQMLVLRNYRESRLAHMKLYIMSTSHPLLSGKMTRSCSPKQKDVQATSSLVSN